MIRAAWQHVRHRTAIDLSCGSIPPRNFARSTTILWLHVESIEHMLDQASVVRQVAGPSTHGGIHCTDTERELLVVHTPGLYLGISIGHLTTGSFLTRSTVLLQSASLLPRLQLLDLHSQRRYAPLDELNAGSLKDRLGRLRWIIAWRGGLILSAAKYV
jgi:hypothetical protein